MPDTGQTTTLTLRVPTLLLAKLRERAQKEGMPADTYAGLIFCAAYSARVRPVGDTELEAALERAFRPAAAREAGETSRLAEQLAERTRERDDQARKARDLFDEAMRAQRAERAAEGRCEELQATVERQAEEIAALRSAPVHPEPAPTNVVALPPSPARVHEDPAPTVPTSTRRMIRSFARDMDMSAAEISEATGVPLEQVEALLDATEGSAP